MLRILCTKFHINWNYSNQDDDFYIKRYNLVVGIFGELLDKMHLAE